MKPATYDRFITLLTRWQEATKHDINSPVHLLLGWIYQQTRKPREYPPVNEGSGDNAELRLSRRTFFVVEATSTERGMLWEKWANESPAADGGSGRRRFKWEQDSQGWLVEVGELEGRPCNISVNWAKIGGRWIMFYDNTSQVTDSVQTEAWISHYFGDKKWDNNSRRSWADAGNFHLCVSAIEEANKEEAHAP